MEKSYTQLWNELLNRLKTEVSEQVFNNWFTQITPVSFSDEKLVLAVPNEFVKEWIDFWFPVNEKTGEREGLK